MRVSILEQDDLKTQDILMPWAYCFLNKLPFTSFNPRAHEEHDLIIWVEGIQLSNLELHFYQNCNSRILIQKLKNGKIPLQEKIYSLESARMNIFNFAKWLGVLKNVPAQLQQQAFIAICIAYVLFLLFTLSLIIYSSLHIFLVIREYL